MEEQTATTEEIARNVRQAAQVTATVGSSIIQGNVAVEQTGTAAAQVLDAGVSLKRHADSLHKEVESLFLGIRAA